MVGAETTEIVIVGGGILGGDGHPPQAERHP